jgi:hypothetical protein
MDPRLTYSPEQYRQKLVDYAKGTVKYQSSNRLIKYKVNKNDNPAVVEDLGDKFKIYISQKSDTFLGMPALRNRTNMTLFFAFITIDEQLGIKIDLQRATKIAFTIFTLYFGALVMTSLFKGYYGALPMSLPVILLGYFSLRYSRRKFKTLVITFLNTIAAS